MTRAKLHTSISGGISTYASLAGIPASFAPLTHNHDAAYEPKNANIQSHISNTSNPHSVTKSQVGLGNADNTSDANKPISTATQNALDDKLFSVYADTNPFTWSVAETQYIDIIVSGTLVIDAGSATAIDCTIELQHGGVGTLDSKVIGFRVSEAGDRIPFTMIFRVSGGGFDGNDFSLVESVYSSTIEEVRWIFNYTL